MLVPCSREETMRSIVLVAAVLVALGGS